MRHTDGARRERRHRPKTVGRNLQEQKKGVADSDEKNYLCKNNDPMPAPERSDRKRCAPMDRHPHTPAIMKRPTVSLIVTTYNWEKALTLYLDSVLRQTVLPDEILVADDGSKEPTRRVVEAFARTSPVPVRHIWHEDDGFRLTVIRNKAIAAARSEYLIQTDGDLILHPDFIKDHLATAQEGCFVSGSRVLVAEALSASLLAAPDKAPRLSFWTRGLKNRANGLRLPLLGRLMNRFRNNRVRGCNMAFWRKDLLAVNGYNEEMTGWGEEDQELRVRLHNSGLRQHTLKFRGIVYHLHHKEASRDRHTINQQILRAAEAGHATRCEKGVGQYL